MFSSVMSSVPIEVPKCCIEYESIEECTSLEYVVWHNVICLSDIFPAVTELMLGNPCDEEGESGYCGAGLVCYFCEATQMYQCVRCKESLSLLHNMHPSLPPPLSLSLSLSLCPCVPCFPSASSVLTPNTTYSASIHTLHVLIIMCYTVCHDVISPVTLCVTMS